MLQIVTAPNPVLSAKAKPVVKVDKAILNLVAEMEEALELDWLLPKLEKA